jgi:hypothetical protein
MSQENVELLRRGMEEANRPDQRGESTVVPPRCEHGTLRSATRVNIAGSRYRKIQRGHRRGL